MKDDKTNKTTEIVKKASSKPEKAQKMVSAKKLPPLFKKKYTEKNFEKKLLKRIFIDKDKELVKSYFEQGTDKKGSTIFEIPLTLQIPAKEAARLKLIAKELKAQKGGIKIVPLIAVAVFCFAIGIGSALFKNIIVEKIITNSMQKIFMAKTDIASVDLKIFSSSLDIINLQQANKDSPMKNLFQIERIKVNFNLTDLLKGKFHAEELIVSGVALDTDRRTSGKLAVKTKKQEKQAAKESETKKNELAANAADKLKEMFAGYNPQKMFESVQSELQSPKIADEIAKEVQIKIEKWQAAPAQMQSTISEFASDVESVTKVNWGGINDVNRLKEALVTVNNAIEKSKTVSDSVGKTFSEFSADAESVKSYTEKLSSSINADTNLVSVKLKEMKSMYSVNGLKQVMNDGIESMIYSVLGKYSPYAIKLMNKALSAKENTGTSNKTGKKVKAPKKEKRQDAQRYKGRTIYWKADRVPKFLIEKAEASGYEYGTDKLLFKGTASNISSNMDMLGLPAKIDAQFTVTGKANTASAVIDARSNTSSPLVSASYKGLGYPVSADAQVFQIISSSDISANASADLDGSFSISGFMDMKVSEMIGMDFEPEQICRIYKNALSGVRMLSIGFRVERNAEGVVSVVITNPEKLSSQLVMPISKALSGELEVIAGNAQKQLVSILSEKTNGAAASVAQFSDIQSAMNGQKAGLTNLQGQLESKKKEINKQIEKLAKDAASDAIKKATGSSEASEAAGKLLKKLF